MGDEVVQEVCELVALTQRHVAADQVLVNHSQVEVITEGVNVHQVPHLVTLLSEKHGELKQRGAQSLPAPNDSQREKKSRTDAEIMFITKRNL